MRPFEKEMNAVNAWGLPDLLRENPKLISFAIAIAIVAPATYFFARDPVAPTELDMKAPPFILRDVDGHIFALSDFKDKVVLLDLMATWCPACNESVPHTKALDKDYSDDELVIISISVDPAYDTNDRLRSYKNSHGSNWTYARDTDNVAYRYRVEQLPTFVIIDKNGSLVYVATGVVPHEELSEEISKLL